MFVCVHDLEYVSHTGSLFICPGARPKNWEESQFSLSDKAWSKLATGSVPARGWQGRGWELTVRWCGWRGGAVGLRESGLRCSTNYLSVACSTARDRAWTSSSVGLCSVPSDAALSWPDPVGLFLTLLPRNAARWWNSETISGPFCLPRSNSWSSYRYHLRTPVVNNAVSVQDFRRRQWHPTPVLLPGKSHGWRSLVGCSLWGHWESDTTEQLHFHFSLPCTGEGNGNPLQCSCLENPRDEGAWWAAVSGVAQSRTRLKQLSSSSSSSAGFCYLCIRHFYTEHQEIKLGIMNKNSHRDCSPTVM